MTMPLRLPSPETLPTATGNLTDEFGRLCIEMLSRTGNSQGYGSRFGRSDRLGLLAADPIGNLGSPTDAMVLADNYTPPRYPGPLPEGFDQAVTRAFDPQLDKAGQAKATEEAAAIGNRSALDLFICADSSNYAATDKVIGEENMGAAEMYGLGDFRYVGVTR
ncbi:hypothetical protein J2W56_001019 [Nocardia kruczakiae]|uniref:Uncharacterized protein n=1 Tax=Nocardia kruczakiae TaxID=261477 RepID=A0ABU1X9T5_9NOCA|nr:hypothetical protein [Nocardia kruczakiae]MDR7167301.1 hypothetical protein [Nocardia kruczakiae]